MIYLTQTSADFEPLTLQMMASSQHKQWTLLESNEQGDFGQPAFNRLTCQRAKAVKMLLDQGNDVFVCDGDVIWLKPLSEMVIEPEADIKAQVDPDSGFCCGFMFLRNTEATKLLVNLWLQVMQDESVTNDQIYFNHALKNLHKVADVNLNMLAFDDVWSYGRICAADEQPLNVWTGQEFDAPKDMLAFHANYTIGIEYKTELLEYICNLSH